MNLQISRSNMLAIEMTEYAITQLYKSEFRINEINLRASPFAGFTRERKISVFGSFLVDFRRPTDSDTRLSVFQQISFAGMMTVANDPEDYRWKPRWIALKFDLPDGIRTINIPCGFDVEDLLRRKIAVLKAQPSAS